MNTCGIFCVYRHDREWGIMLININRYGTFCVNNMNRCETFSIYNHEQVVDILCY